MDTCIIRLNCSLSPDFLKILKRFLIKTSGFLYNLLLNKTFLRIVNLGVTAYSRIIRNKKITSKKIEIREKLMMGLANF